MKKKFQLCIVVALVLLCINSFYGVTVTATVERDSNDNQCPLYSPIFVKVQNNTLSAIRDVTFNLELHKSGRPQNLLTGSSTYVFDLPVSPFSSEAKCYTNSYVKSFIEPRLLDTAPVSHEELISVLHQSFKKSTEFESKHKVSISNVKISSFN